MKVLIIDDEPLMCASLCAAMKGAGFEVSSFNAPREGLEAAASGLYDVLVVDIWMPGMDGIDIIKSLRASNPHQRIIAMTGGGPALSTESVAAIVGIWGAERMFIKPFDEALLIKAISSAEVMKDIATRKA